MTQLHETVFKSEDQPSLSGVTGGPAERTPLGILEQEAQQVEKINYKNYPILFVDDEEENCEIFSINFRNQFTIFTASNGADGLNLLEQESVALVLSDQRMPGMTGMEFLKEVRNRHPEIVTILVTAYSDLDVLADGVSAGLLYSYLLKPWEIKDLNLALCRGIEHYYLVAERDRLYREQIETLKKMARANKLTAVGTLAAGIAHEIRNPLVSIQTFLEMLPKKLSEIPLSDPTRLDREFWEEFHTLSLGEIQRIRTLISELVNFARPAPPNFSEEDLALVIRSMAELTRNEAEKRGIEMVINTAPPLPRVRIDPSKIKQVLLNLILNAFHAMREGGKLEILATSADLPTKGKRIQVIVRDNGEGIPREIRDQVFDPFFTTKDPGEGIGLGLTICHQIMEEHGAEIEIESRPGDGTQVILTFSIENSAG